MKVIHSRPEANFTQITNDVMRDERIDDMARGVLCKMLSHADGWSTTADALWKQAAAARPWVRNGAGRRVYRNAFRQLEAAGYLQREKVRHKDGRFETVLILRCRPAHWDSVGPPKGSDDPPAAGVPETAPRHRGTGNGRSVSGTSIRTLEPQTLNSGSGELGLPAGSRGKPRERAQPSDEQIVAITRMAIAQVYGDRENIITDDEEVLDLYGYYVSDRNPPHPGAYLRKIFGDAPDLQTLVTNSFSSEQAAEGLDAIRYGRCPGCGEPFGEQKYPQADRRCGACTREAG